MPYIGKTDWRRKVFRRILAIVLSFGGLFLKPRKKNAGDQEPKPPRAGTARGWIYAQKSRYQARGEGSEPHNHMERPNFSRPPARVCIIRRQRALDSLR